MHEKTENNTRGKTQKRWETKARAANPFVGFVIDQKPMKSPMNIWGKGCLNRKAEMSGVW